MTDGLLHKLYHRHFFATDWNIGSVRVSAADIERLVTQGKLGRINWWWNFSPFRFRADPFLWLLEGNPRVIYEEMRFLKRRAHICSRPLRRFGHSWDSRPEIVQPFHLSYPFTLKYDGVWYCIPESARASGVDLYVWDRLAATWTLKSRLIDQTGILDATLFKWAGIWYLFGTIRGNGSYDKLRIWWSEDLAGEWRAHRLNPAKVDTRSARSAGPLFEFHGRWYRPAQDCTAGYGSAITINRIDELTPQCFRETTVSRVEPDPNGPYPDGLHTLAVAEDYILLDGKREGFTASLPLMKAVRRIARRLGTG